MGTHPIFESDFDCLTESFRVGIVGLAGSSAEEESFLDGADPFCAQLQPEVGIKPLKSSQKLVKRRCLDRIGRLRSRLSPIEQIVKQARRRIAAGKRESSRATFIYAYQNS